MGKTWKYTKKAEKHVCGKCRVPLCLNEFLLCKDCWQEYHQKERERK